MRCVDRSLSCSPAATSPTARLAPTSSRIFRRAKSSTATKDTTATPSVESSKAAGPCRTFRPRPIASGRTASHLPLSESQRYRAHILLLEGLPPSCDTIRSKRRALPRRRLHRCSRQLLVMGLDHSFIPMERRWLASCTSPRPVPATASLSCSTARHAG